MRIFIGQRLPETYVVGTIHPHNYFYLLPLTFYLLPNKVTQNYLYTEPI
jgi:hypothetical protein